MFVHSRKETAKTAKMLRDMAIENNTIGKYLGDDSASREILTQEAEGVKNADLKVLSLKCFHSMFFLILVYPYEKD